MTQYVAHGLKKLNLQLQINFLQFAKFSILYIIIHNIEENFLLASLFYLSHFVLTMVRQQDDKPQQQGGGGWGV